MNFDFFLYTDGSGYQDGYGGSGSLVLSPKHNLYLTRMAAASGTTVERAEFEALLMGLQSILEAMKWEKPFELERLSHERATVQWVSDRESLVGSVQRDADGNTVNARRASPDLWARFAFYERLFDITAVHAPRETNAYHGIVDRLASDARVLVKDYMQLPDNSVGELLREASGAAA